MRAAIFEGVGKIKAKEIEKPSPKRGEILLKVMACAVCGTDVRILSHGHPRITPPFIIGHEIAGMIEEIHGEADGLKEGDRVVVPPLISCGECFYCKNSLPNLCSHKTSIAYELPGGFSQYMIIPHKAVLKGNLIKIPDPISFTEASLVEPLACCIHGQHFLTLSATTVVLIIGSGPIGLMHMQLAKAKGVRQVGLADISSLRIEKAKPFDPDFLIHSAESNLVEEIRRITHGMGPNAVVVACPSMGAIHQAFEVISKGGEILLFAGLPKEESHFSLDVNAIHYSELKLYGSFASTNKTCREAMAFIRDGKINSKKLITHTFPLEEIEAAIEMSRSGKALKVVILPNGMDHR